MNRDRTGDRSGRTRAAGAGTRKGGSRFGSPAPRRSQWPARSGGYARRHAETQGEFALPETITPALPAVEAFTDLGMPEPLLAELGKQGVRAPFPIQGATASDAAV